MHNAEFTKGSYDWKEVKEKITAPEGAIRMSLFFGLRPARAGWTSTTSTSAPPARDLPRRKRKSSGRACRWPKSAWRRPWTCQWQPTAPWPTTLTTTARADGPTRDRWPTCESSRRASDASAACCSRFQTVQRASWCSKVPLAATGNLSEKVAIPVGQQFRQAILPARRRLVQPRRQRVLPLRAPLCRRKGRDDQPSGRKT